MPWESIGKARAPDGGELVLYHRNGEFSIRVGGRELMSSRAHGSEEFLAQMSIERAGAGDGARVLIGGLGLGYTLRAALDALPASASVLVAELVPAVVDWNRGPLAPLAARPLDDPRARVETADVGAVIRRAGPRWDVIMLDVDNGPAAMTRKANQALYGETGLATAKRALKRGGVLAVWSAAADPTFVKRMKKAGFEADSVDVPARGVAGGPQHTLFFGRVAS